MITVTGEDVYYTDEEDDSQHDDGGELFEAWGCLFGERCCMPGLHFEDKCHKAEMAEEWMSGEE